MPCRDASLCSSARRAILVTVRSLSYIHQIPNPLCSIEVSEDIQLIIHGDLSTSRIVQVQICTIKRILPVLRIGRLPSRPYVIDHPMMQPKYGISRRREKVHHLWTYGEVPTSVSTVVGCVHAFRISRSVVCALKLGDIGLAQEGVNVGHAITVLHHCGIEVAAEAMWVVFQGIGR